MNGLEEGLTSSIATSQEQRHIIIVGGGVTGLAAACKAQELMGLAEADGEITISTRVTLYEASDRLGGKIQTLRTDSCVLELGADSFLARKEAAVRLCIALGIDHEWVGTGPDATRTWLAQDGELYPFPSGTYMGIPANEEGIEASPFLSDAGKVRALTDLTLPDASPTGDESMRAFLVRRFGDEMVERIAEAVMSGIYGGRAEDLSLLATFPEFRAWERQYGSVLLGMQARLQQMGAARGALTQSSTSTTFLSLQQGLYSLIEALADRFTRAGGQIQMQMEVICVSQTVEICTGKPQYEVTFSNGQQACCDGLIIAAPTFAAAQMLGADPQLAHDLQSIPYASVATVLLLYRASDWTTPPRGSGFVVPRRERLAVTAVTWTSSKWPHSTPDDRIAIRAFVGRSEDDALVLASDAEIKQRVRADLGHLMGKEVQAIEPVRVVITRWLAAMPQYQVGHLERIERIQARVQKNMPGLRLAGAAYAGVGIPDCIVSAELAAAAVCTELLKPRTL